MPIIFTAIIGYVRFVIGQGRRLSWVRGSLLYSVFNEKQGPLDKRELLDCLAKSSGYCHVRYPLPSIKWMVGKSWFPVRDPMIFGFSNISSGWASHFVSRPQ